MTLTLLVVCSHKVGFLFADLRHICVRCLSPSRFWLLKGKTLRSDQNPALGSTVLFYSLPYLYNA